MSGWSPHAVFLEGATGCRLENPRSGNCEVGAKTMKFYLSTSVWRVALRGTGHPVSGGTRRSETQGVRFGRLAFFPPGVEYESKPTGRGMCCRRSPLEPECSPEGTDRLAGSGTRRSDTRRARFVRHAILSGAGRCLSLPGASTSSASSRFGADVSAQVCSRTHQWHAQQHA